MGSCWEWNNIIMQECSYRVIDYNVWRLFFKYPPAPFIAPFHSHQLRIVVDFGMKWFVGICLANHDDWKKTKNLSPQMVVQHGDESYIGQSVQALMFSHFIDRQTSKTTKTLPSSRPASACLDLERMTWMSQASFFKRDKWGIIIKIHTYGLYYLYIFLLIFDLSADGHKYTISINIIRLSSWSSIYLCHGDGRVSKISSDSCIVNSVKLIGQLKVYNAPRDPFKTGIAGRASQNIWTIYIYIWFSIYSN